MKSDWIETTEFSITQDAVRTSATNVLPAGAVVVASRVGLGKVCRVRIDTAINQDLRGFLPKRRDQIDEQYLFHWFRSVAHKIVAAGTGATVQGVTLPFLKSLQIPLPPIKEQRRIVALLDEAFADIDTATANAENNLDNARELMRAATVGRLEPRPEGWVEKSLGSFCDIYQPETISKKHMSEDGDYPVFGANGKIGRYDRYNHQEPQLLVTCRGATCGSINMSEPRSWITGNSMVVRPRNSELRLGLLRRIFETGFNFNKIITGSAQPQITRQSFAPAKITFPTNLIEQVRLETELDEIQTQLNSLEQCYELRARALAELKRSLLHRAFTAELVELERELVPA